MQFARTVSECALTSQFPDDVCHVPSVDCVKLGCYPGGRSHFHVPSMMCCTVKFPDGMYISHIYVCVSR